MYRDYDQAALDAQYKLSPQIPDFEDCFNRRISESARVASQLNFTPDIAYGPSPGMTLDVFPANVKNAPVNIFIHGGYWHMLDKKDFRFIAEPFVSAGATFVNINYDLAPNITVAEIVRQVRQAVLWTFEHIADYGGDPAKIHVSGHSAGGHLTAMALITDWTALGSYPADLLKSGCAISGIYDLEPIRRCYLNEVLSLQANEINALSPVYHVPENAPTLLTAVGGLETEEYIRHTEEIAYSWQDKGNAVQEMVVPDTHHFTILEEFARSGSPLLTAFLNQMGL